MLCGFLCNVCALSVRPEGEFYFNQTDGRVGKALQIADTNKSYKRVPSMIDIDYMTNQPATTPHNIVDIRTVTHAMVIKTKSYSV